MDGMTIDEVIKYFDEDAKENAKLAIIYKGNDDDLAEMHKQDSNRSAYVSVWLRELELYRETLIGRPCEVCEFHETGSCSRWECVFEEVNADEPMGD